MVGQQTVEPGWKWGNQDSWCAGAGWAEEVAKGDLESLSLEMVNNRGSCHCCLGCGSAWNQAAKWNSFSLNRRLSVSKVKQSRSWWLGVLRISLTIKAPGTMSTFQFSHGSWASTEGPSWAYHHLFFSTTHSLPFVGSVLLRPLAQRTSWPLPSCILRLKTWQQNADQEVSLVVRHCSGWGSLGVGVTERPQPLAKQSEDKICQMCVAGPALLFSPYVV